MLCLSGSLDDLYLAQEAGMPRGVWKKQTLDPERKFASGVNGGEDGGDENRRPQSPVGTKWI